MYLSLDAIFYLVGVSWGTHVGGDLNFGQGSRLLYFSGFLMVGPDRGRHPHGGRPDKLCRSTRPPPPRLEGKLYYLNFPELNDFAGKLKKVRGKLEESSDASPKCVTKNALNLVPKFIGPKPNSFNHTVTHQWVRVELQNHKPQNLGSRWTPKPWTDPGSRWTPKPQAPEPRFAVTHLTPPWMLES